jgi:hypothetical protein
MTKKHFIALADAIREHNDVRNYRGLGSERDFFQRPHIEALADFCKSQNGRSNRERWLSYIAGECGPNGGSIKKAA